MILPCHKTTCRKGVGRWKRIICFISHTIFYRGKIFPVFTKMTLFFFKATLTTQFNNNLHKSLKFIMPRKLMMTQYWNRSIMIQNSPSIHHYSWCVLCHMSKYPWHKMCDSCKNTWVSGLCTSERNRKACFKLMIWLVKSHYIFIQIDNHSLNSCDC